MLSAILPATVASANDGNDSNDGWTLVWSDESDYDGAPDSTVGISNRDISETMRPNGIRKTMPSAATDFCHRGKEDR